jgi:hypothetical protein
MAAPSDTTRRPRGAGSFTQQRQSVDPQSANRPLVTITEDTQPQCARNVGSIQSENQAQSKTSVEVA